MKNKYLTRRWELSCLMINLIIYKVFTDAPKRFMAAGNSAFLSAFISAIIAYLVIWFLPVVYKKAGVKNIFELLNGKKSLLLLAGFIIIGWMLLSAADALESIVAFSKIAAFPSAPFVFVAVFFMFAFSFAVLRGMDATVRPNALIVPFYIFIILLTLLSVVRYFDLTNLLPIFGVGIEKTIFTSFRNLSYFFDFVLIFLINPFFKDEKNFVKTVRISGAVGIIINLLIILSINLLIPYPASKQIEYPLYQIMKSVYFGRFLQRIDAVYLLSVSLSAMGYLSFVTFLMTYTFKHALSLSHNRPFVWSLSLSVLFLAMLIHKGESDYFYNILMAFEALAIIFLVLTPVLIGKERVKK